MQISSGSGRVTLALGLLTLLTACGSSAAPPPAASSSGGEITDNTAWQVTLLEAGDGERSLLRYHVEPGLTASAYGRIQMEIHTVVGGQETPSPPLPPMRFGYTIETTERVGDAIRYRFRYDDASFEPIGDPGVDARLADLMAPLRRATGEAVVNDRGRVVELAVHVPEDLPAELTSIVSQMEDMMRQVAAPLPAEPVAVGATWTHESPIETAMGMSMLQRSTYRLVARDGDRIELAIRTEVSATPGPLPSPAEGMSLTLNSMVGEGSGTLTLHLDAPVPDAGETSVRLHQEATIASARENAPMQIDLAVRVTLGR